LVLYDETSRKAWALEAARGKLCFISCGHLHATLSLQGDSDFDLKAASLKLDNELLDEAKALYLVEFPAKEHVVAAAKDPVVGSLADSIAPMLRNAGSSNNWHSSSWPNKRQRQW
jgi:hypothetical protein